MPVAQLDRARDCGSRGWRFESSRARIKMFFKQNKLRFVSILFFFSGFAALTYQIIWTRLLLLTFGNTTYSVVAVLAAFMAGLGLGGYLFGKLSQKLTNPIKIFGLIELGVGVISFLIPFLFKLLNSYYVIVAVGGASGTDFILFKFIATLLTILPVTTLMGGTLPVVVSAFSKESSSPAKLVGRLYAINTFGSIIGALFAAFVAIEIFGLTKTIYLCSLINFSIFTVTLFISSKRLVHKERIIQPNPLYKTSNSLKRNIVIILYGLSGITSMALEVLWIRLLTPTIGTYIYAFSGVLAVFLLGLSLGSFFYEKYLYKLKDTFTLLGTAELSIALSAFFSIVVTSSGIIPLNPIYHTLLVVFPGTFAMGTILPAITTLSGKKELGSFIGKALMFNCFGSVLGPLLAGFIFIPLVGTTRSVLVISIITSFFALILLLLGSNKKSFSIRLMPLLSALFALVISLIIISGKDSLFTQRFIKHQKAIHQGEKQLYLEDEVATVFVYSSSDYKQRGLIIDGVETTRLVPETKLIAHLPLLIHKNPQNVLIIALGMGTTFRSSLTYPVQNVDVVELVPSVVKTFPLFHNDAQQILADSRGKIIVNDGRQYVHITNKKYDVVTIDPPPPVNSAGTTVLYSKEFYQDIKKDLDPAGLVQQWFFFDEKTSESELKMLIKTFIDQFKHTLVFRSPNNLGISIVASDTPLEFSRSLVEKRLVIEKVKKDLEEWSDTPKSYTEFNNLLLGSKKVVSEYTQNSLIITDNNPRTEYFLVKRIFKPSPLINPDKIIQQLQAIAKENN